VAVVKDLNHHAALNKDLGKKIAEKDAELSRLRERPWWMRWLGK
jgi:hypothetical protein